MDLREIHELALQRDVANIFEWRWRNKVLSPRIQQEFRDYGLVEAIRRLITIENYSTHFRILCECGLWEVTLEHLVLKYPRLFGPNYQKIALARLKKYGYTT